MSNLSPLSTRRRPIKTLLRLGSPEIGEHPVQFVCIRRRRWSEWLLRGLELHRLKLLWRVLMSRHELRSRLVLLCRHKLLLLVESGVEEWPGLPWRRPGCDKGLETLRSTAHRRS